MDYRFERAIHEIYCREVLSRVIFQFGRKCRSRIRLYYIGTVKGFHYLAIVLMAVIVADDYLASHPPTAIYLNGSRLPS